MLELALWVVALLVTSALASGTEAAMFAVSVSKVEAFVEEKQRGALALQKVKENMAATITTVVVINNIANIVGSIFVGSVAAKVLEPYELGPLTGVALFSGLLTFFVIAFSEIVPKTVGERNCDRIALWTAGPVLWISRLFKPLLMLLDFVTSPFTKLGNVGSAITSEAEIRALTELGEKAGVIEHNESEIIRNVFTLNDNTAADLMTPLHQVDYLQASDNIDSIREHLAELTHTRLPVIDRSFDKLEGVVNIRTLLQALAEDKDDALVRDFIYQPTFIASTATGDDLLALFKKSKQHLGIVVDGFGTMLGVLTLEDVLEVLVGDIMDETDQEHEEIVVEEPGVVLVYPEADAIEVNETIHVNLPDLRIGELILDELGEIPEVGRVFLIKDAEIEIVEGTPRAINLVRIRRVEPEEISEDGDTTRFSSIETANPAQ